MSVVVIAFICDIVLRLLIVPLLLGVDLCIEGSLVKVFLHFFLSLIGLCVDLDVCGVLTLRL